MNKIIKTITRGDFLLHVLMCFIVAVIIATITAHLSVGNVAPAIVGAFMGGLACGLGKEYGDYVAADNNWSWTDVVADAIGAAIGSQIGWVALLI